jgi:hypothetical protein
MTFLVYLASLSSAAEPAVQARHHLVELADAVEEALGPARCVPAQKVGAAADSPCATALRRGSWVPSLYVQEVTMGMC